MVREFRETVSIPVKGTIIDIESIGEFDRSYPSWDPRQYVHISPTIFGYITSKTLVQYCAEGEDEIQEKQHRISETLQMLKEPYYALNSNFERCLIENTCGLQLVIKDVRGHLSGSKWSIRERLKIPRYGDPFNGSGYMCLLEWQKGNYDECLKHNRACLLIERDILEHIQGLK